MKHCPYCGAELTDDVKFCVECGKALPEDAPVAEAAPAEPGAAPIPVPVAEAAPTEPAAAPIPVPVAEEPVRPEAPAQASAPEMPIVTQMPPRKQLLSTFQYILLSLLYALPVIGLVFLFIFGAGHPKNGSLKRFSAAMLILRLLFWITVLALAIVAMVKNGRLLSDALSQLIPAVENLIQALFA